VGTPDLQWSEVLAARAERWAVTLAEKGCVLQMSGAQRFGENLFRIEPAGSRVPQLATPSSVVGYWASEAADYS
jgi:hypothetical protein